MMSVDKGLKRYINAISDALEPGTLPSSPFVGQFAVDADDENKLKRWDGSTWNIIEVNTNSDPTTKKGDIAYRNSSSLNRLAIGSNGQVLSVNSGIPAWKNLTDIAFNVDTTHHVYISPDGNDTTGDGSPSFPLQTLNKGVNDFKAASGITVYHIKGTVVESVAFSLSNVGNIAIVGDGVEASTLVVTGTNGLQLGCTSPLSNVFLSNLTVDNQDDDNATTGLYLRTSDTLTNLIISNVRIRGRGNRMVQILNNSGNIQDSVFKDIEIEFGVEPTTPPAGVTGLFLTDWDGSELIVDGLIFRNLSLTGGSMAGISYLVEFGSNTNVLIQNLEAIGSILSNIGRFQVFANVGGSTADMKLVGAEIDITAPAAHADVVVLLAGAYFRDVDVRLLRETGGTVFQTWVCQDPQNYSDKLYLQLGVHATANITPAIQTYQALYMQAGQTAFLGDIEAVFIGDIDDTFLLDASATQNGAVYIADSYVLINKLVARAESIGLGSIGDLEVIHNAMVAGSNIVEVTDLVAELRELTATFDTGSVPIALTLASGTQTFFVRRGVVASNVSAGTTNAVVGSGGGTLQLSRPAVDAIKRRDIANAVSGVSLVVGVSDGNI